MRHVNPKSIFVSNILDTHDIREMLRELNNPKGNVDVRKLDEAIRNAIADTYDIAYERALDYAKRMKPERLKKL